MDKKADICDKFDSINETVWLRENWELGMRTRNVKSWASSLTLAGLMVGTITLVGYMGYMVYDSYVQTKWHNDMTALYAPYNAAVNEINKLGYCRNFRCDDLKVEWIIKRDNAWKKLCDAKNSKEYINELKEERFHYQACD